MSWSKVSFASWSTLSFPSMPQWLGIQQKRTHVPLSLNDQSRFMIQQWRAATVIPIPKPNKDHTDPLSYRPIALTSCLGKDLERMINTRFIWYLEKYRILDRSQCGFRKYSSTSDHLVSLERYLRDAFAQRQQAVGLFFDFGSSNGVMLPGNKALSEPWLTNTFVTIMPSLWVMSFLSISNMFLFDTFMLIILPMSPTAVNSLTNWWNSDI